MTDLRAMYLAMTAPALKRIINNAVRDHSLPEQWKADLTNNKTVLVDHINDMCNEHSITPDANGNLIRY